MKLIRLKLAGYKRLALRNIREFEIVPESIYQLLLGTNGSGKSSVMVEMTPLPAQHQHYHKGGYKIIELLNRGKTYILTSDFSVGNKHSFLCDDVELNPGGTASVQKELVKQHFAYDDDIHDLLVGNDRFTRMSPQRRREWLIRISGSDLSFAITLFQKLKSRTRDMHGVVKHLKQRWMNESGKLPTAEKMQEYLQSVDLLKTELTLMMEAKDPSVTESEQLVASRIRTNLSYIEELSIAIIEARLDRPEFIAANHFTGLGDIDTLIAEERGSLKSAIGMVDHYLNEHQKIHEIVQAMEQTNAAGLEDLRKRTETLREERNALVGTLVAFTPIECSASILAASMAIRLEMIEILTEIPENTNGFYSRESYDTHLSVFEQSRQQIDQCRRDIDRMEERLQHIKDGTKENCPKCGHIWMPGVGEDEIDRLTNTVTLRRGQLDIIETRRLASEEYLNKYQAYMSYRKRLVRIIEANPQMKPVWDVIIDQQLVSKAPRKAMVVWKNWIDDLTVMIRIEELNASITLFETAIEKAQAAGIDGHVQENVSKLTHQLEDSITKKEQLIQQIRALSVYRETMAEVVANAEKLSEVRRKVNDDMQLIVRVIRNDLLQKGIRDHLSALSHNEQIIVAAKGIETVIYDIEQSMIQAQRDAQTLGLLTDELSPTDGLIAEQLKGFINSLIEQMNGLISKVWTYDMAIAPCGMESDELDYKFPLVIENNHEDAISDVSKGSSSQIDMIDFAFKLVATLYLGFEDYPLFLDELAPSFDEQHRINLMRLITELVETHRCSQLFMISHYAATHGALTNAQVCLMDERNIITKPHQYNAHVRIV